MYLSEYDNNYSQMQLHTSYNVFREVYGMAGIIISMFAKALKK